MRHRQLSWWLLAAASISLWMSLPATAGATVTATATFAIAGSSSFTVPAGVTSVDVTAQGAAGGSAGSNAGGEGAAVAATVPVTPGEVLAVGVGGVGVAGAGAGNGTGGGIGGGGKGNFGTLTQGAGGGGASLLGVASPSPGFGLLVVAGGGGGAGGGSAGDNADHGGVGPSDGGAGTPNGGGAGGSGSNNPGVSGSFGLGGQGGSGGSQGGGGGGGGYFGGGGGGGGTTGGGGGGGASFVTAQGTNVSGPAPSGNTARVTITYAAPIADESTTAIGFASTQPQGVASAAQSLVVTNDGSAPLVVSNVVLGGADSGDYLIDDGCQQPVAAGASCTIGVRFAPQAPGASAATLTLLTNAVTAPPTVALTGTGATASPGAGGSPGSTGPQGATGPKGAAGAPGKVRLVTCHAISKTVVRKHKKVAVTERRCTTKTVTGKATFTTTAASAHATLSRGGVVVARGRALDGGRLVLRALRPLAPGAYTLTVRTRRAGRTATRSERVTLG